MKELFIYVIHTPAGVVALVSAILALIYKKGSPRHLLTGKLFTISMMIMLFSGAVISVVTRVFDDFFLSVAVIYTVFTAWLTVHRKNGETGVLEYLALFWVLVLGSIAVFIAPAQASKVVPEAYLFWFVFCLLAAGGDAWNIYRSGYTYRHRMIRHIWRVCFSLAWAVMAFGDKIAKAFEAETAAIPAVVGISTLSVLIIMVYWMVKVVRCAGNKLPVN